MSSTPAWLPLESNPEVLNPFLSRLGCPKEWQFCDVFGLDPELLMMVPRPCVALCLLFPCEKIAGPRRSQLKAARSGAGAHEAGLFFTQQHDGCGNACGTIASIHAVANASRSGAFPLGDDTLLGRFLKETEGQDAAARGTALVDATYLHELSNETAASGETEGAGTDDAGGRHFICFLVHDGRLFELDGRIVDERGNAFPVDHGPTNEAGFVEDAAKVIRDQFMAMDPENLNFNVVAFSKVD